MSTLVANRTNIHHLKVPRLKTLRERAHLINQGIIRTCLRDFQSGIITPKVRILLRELGTQTLLELENESEWLGVLGTGSNHGNSEKRNIK